MVIGSLFTVIKYEGDQSTVLMYCMLRYLHIDLETPPLSSHDLSASADVMNITKSIAPLNQTHLHALDPAKQILPIEASLYWLGFVIFLYALPLTIIVILYGLMLKFLRGARGQSVGKSKRRATRMILAVILTYALCWFLMQLLFVSNVILSRNVGHDYSTYMDILTMFANVFAYLNSVCPFRCCFRECPLCVLVYQSDSVRVHVEELPFLIHRSTLLSIFETAPLRGIE